MKQAGHLLPTPVPLCVSQAVFLNSGISGFEYLDKIVQLPFCLPNIEEEIVCVEDAGMDGMEDVWEILRQSERKHSGAPQSSPRWRRPQHASRLLASR